jgi:glucose/arabinose dehydrogenase
MAARYFFILLLLLIPQHISCSNTVSTEKIKLPDHFSMEMYAQSVETVRALAFADDGTLFAGSWNGNVYAITKDRKVHIIDKGLRLPLGIDFYDGDLYVSALNRINKYKNIVKNIDDPSPPEVILSSLPDETIHGGKFIKIGPDRKIYMNIGMPCNVCLSEDVRFGTISRIDLDGNNFEIYVSGIRNSVGFDWHPETGELKDPEYWERRPSIDFTPPAYELQAHVAPLGMRFYTGKMFPDRYRSGIFIAEHGSWNRSKKTGYRVSFVKVFNSKAVSYEIFAYGWLEGESAWGRPVDVEIGPDGSLFVSDDKAGVIYRIYYTAK